MITPEQKDVLNEYADIKSQIKVLEAAAELRNPMVLEIMVDNELGEISIPDMGKLSMASRRTWKYTNKVTELDKTLKEQKQLEERVGDATYTEKSYVVFKGLKDSAE